MSKNNLTIAERYAKIINSLNTYEYLSIHDLADITDADERTLQRDLNKRLKKAFKIEKVPKKPGYYRINKKYQGYYTVNQIEKLATLTGLKELLPDYNLILNKITEDAVFDTFSIKSPFEKQTQIMKDFFDKINSAISNKRILRFSYRDKRYEVNPYKLINIKGHWYLGCTNENKSKTFRLSIIKSVNVRELTFIPDPVVVEKFNNNETIWIGDNELIDIEILVTSDFAEYFKDRIVLPGQTSVIENEDGTLIVKAEVHFIDEIKGVIKYWIPRLVVNNPISLKNEINNELKDYAF